MKSTFDLLSSGERELLANFYGTPTYEALKHLLELERLNSATKMLEVDPNDVVVIARHQGRADNCKQLHLGLKRNYKSQVKAEKKQKG